MSLHDKDVIQEVKKFINNPNYKHLVYAMGRRNGKTNLILEIIKECVSKQKV